MDEVLKSLVTDPSKATSKKTKVGDGSYAHVFDSDGFIPNTVTKVVSPETQKSYKNYLIDGTFVDAWLFWAVYTMTTSKKKKWFPKIYALHIDWEKSTYHAVMEKLENSVVGKFHNYFDTEVKHLSDDYYMKKLKGVSKPGFKKVFAEIQEMLPFFYFDGHSANWMWRKGENESVVATDPLHISNKQKAENMKAFNEAVFKLAQGCPNIIMSGAPKLDALV